MENDSLFPWGVGWGLGAERRMVGKEGMGRKRYTSCR